MPSIFYLVANWRRFPRKAADYYGSNPQSRGLISRCCRAPGKQQQQPQPSFFQKCARRAVVFAAAAAAARYTRCVERL
jgi:hypothetical protein